MKPSIAALGLLCGALSAAPRPCLQLNENAQLRAQVASGHPVCFAFDLETDTATQLRLEQPVDLVLTDEAGAVTDAFEFGIETLTILAAGRHRVEVRPLASARTGTWTFSLSRIAVPLDTAPAWRRAEEAATESKSTGEAERIAASMSLWKDLGDVFAVARTYLKAGDAAFAGNDSRAARDEVEDALRLCHSIGDLRCEGEAANNSGYASFLLGDLQASSGRLREAADIWDRLSMPEARGQTLSNLGLMFWQAAEYAQAIDTLDQARLLLRGRNAVAHALALNNLGVCYQSLAEYDKAIAYFQSALGVYLSHHEERRVVEARLNLGRSYMLQGLLGRAEPMFRLALADATRIRDTAARANVLNNLGQVLLRRQRPEQARDVLDQALHLQQQVRSRRGEAIALHYLGVESANKENWQAARQFFGDAVRIRHDCGLRDDASDSLLALAEVEYRAHNLAAAREYVNQAIGLIESLRSGIPVAALRATYYARKRRFFDLATDIAMSSADGQAGAAGFLASEQARGRSLLDLLTGAAVKGGSPDRLFTRRAELRRQIDVIAFRLAGPEPVSASAGGGQQARPERDELARHLLLLLSEEGRVESSIRDAQGSRLGRPLSSVAELQVVLPEETAVLEYYLGERQSYLWYIQRGGIRSFVLAKRAVIDTLAQRTVERFGDITARRRSPREQAAFEADLRRLSDLLLGPLAGIRLPRRLIVAPDGVLNRVPMAALRSPGALQPLGLTTDLISVPSAASLLAIRPSRAIAAFRRSVLAVVDPVFSADDPRVRHISGRFRSAAGLPRLPFTGEVDALRSLVPPERIRVLQGFDASVSALRKADLANFGVVHFSTHALIDDRIPELSRLVLSLVDVDGKEVDGYLHPYGFAELPMDGAIVALSSCETALGREVPGEGLNGFGASLFAAGASQLVLALTTVDAEASEAFFTEAYQSFFSTGGSRMEAAATQARRALARSARWADPYYWASFVVMGRPSS
jgi:CHAT domain-containing protein/tetratricopeptide (TPR) repeat protein